MTSFKRAIAFAATAASLLAAPVGSLAAGGAALHAAEAAARSDYRNAVARCNQTSGEEQRRCMREADAARKSLGRNLLPGVGPAIDDTTDRGSRGGSRPANRQLHDIERLPDNLAGNAFR